MELESRLWALAGDWIAGTPGPETIALLSSASPDEIPDDLWTYLAPALTVAGGAGLRGAAISRAGAAVLEEERQRDAALRITESLEARGLAHAFFKGTDLRYRAYPDPHRRDAQDLDLLCSPAGARDVLEALRDLGFLPAEDTRAFVEGRTHEATVRSAEAVVDLHVAPLQPGRSRFAADDVLARRTLADVPGGRLPVPDPVDALALCLIHIGVHEGGAEHVAFKHGLDVALAFRAWPALDPAALASRVAGWRCRRLAGAGLWTWRPVLRGLVPDEAYRRIDPGPLARFVATRARRANMRPRERATGLGRLAQLGRKLIYAEGLRERRWLLGELWRRRGTSPRPHGRQET